MTATQVDARLPHFARPLSRPAHAGGGVVAALPGASSSGNADSERRPFTIPARARCAAPSRRRPEGRRRRAEMLLMTTRMLIDAHTTGGSPGRRRQG
ncbi:hypothetical protein AB5I41_15610 [Sphingomonas sp. MMS24-JH45]